MVEWKKLGEIEKAGILTLGRGKVISKNDMLETPGDYPVYSSSSQGDGKIGSYGLYMFDDERITWSIDGGGRLFYRNNQKYSVTNVCGWLKVNKNNIYSTRFLYYILYNQWAKLVFDYSHKAHPSVIRNEYILPILNISEQQRIVDILDTFTSSIDNLKQQIEQRRKQYEYYRDNLLDLEGKEGVEVEKIAEFVKERISANKLTVKNYISVENMLKNKAGRIDAEVVPTEGNWIRYQKGDILIGNIRPYLRKIWLSDREGGTNGDVIVLRISDKYLPDYLFYCLSSESFFKYYNQVLKEGKMPRGEKKRVLTYTIPQMGKKEQSRIVSILDTFEDSIRNLEEQLKLREKQYEYYRNKLLTF